MPRWVMEVWRQYEFEVEAGTYAEALELAKKSNERSHLAARFKSETIHGLENIDGNLIDTWGTNTKDVVWFAARLGHLFSDAEIQWICDCAREVTVVIRWQYEALRTLRISCESSFCADPTAVKRLVDLVNAGAPQCFPRALASNRVA